MITINASDFKQNLYKFLKQTIVNNETLTISTEEGNVIAMSELRYNELVDTLYLTSSSKMNDKLIKGKRTPKEECVLSNKIKW